MLYTVRGLDESAKGVTVRVRVVSKGSVRTVKTKSDGQEHQVVDLRVGDWTGMTTLTLWDEQVDRVNEDDLVDIENGYVTRFKGRLGLNVGKFGRVENVEDSTFPSGEELRRRHPRWRGRAGKVTG